MADPAVESCIASCSDVVKFWDLQTFTELSTVNPFLHQQQRAELSSLSWSANGQFVSCTDVSGKEISIITHGSADKPVLYSHKQEDVGYTCASFLSSSRYLVAGTKQSVLHLWDLKNKNVIRTFRGHSSSVSSLSVHSKDNYVASAGSNGMLLLHRKDSSQPLASLIDGSGQAINRVRFSPLEKSLFATTTATGALSLWSAESLRLLVEFTGAHTASATDACFSPFNNMLLASCGQDGRIVFYDVISRKIVSDTPLSGPISSVLMIKDGKTIVVGASDGMIYACDMRSSGTPYASVKAHNTPVTCLCLPNKIHRSHASLKRVSSVPVTNSSTVTPMVLPSSITSSVIPEYSTATPPSSANRLQLASDLFSPLPGASTHPPRVATTTGPALKGHRSDTYPLLVTTSWTTGLTESVTTSTAATSLYTGTPTLQIASSSSSLHSSVADRDDVTSMDLHPSNEHMTTITTTASTLPHHTTGVQSPIEDSTDGVMAQPPSNFHIQFLENIVQDSMEELKYSLHRDMRYLYADFLRQLSIQGHQQQMQLNRMESMFTNEINSLREENRRLQQENTRLKTLY